MKKRLVRGLIIVGAMLGTVGCVEGYNPDGTAKSSTTVELPANVQAALDAPVSTLDENLTNTLSYMGNEERLAYDVYNALYAEYGTKQFINIANNGEYKHITAVQALVQKYKLNDNVDFTNVDLEPLGYMNTSIENMEAGTYDIEKIQELYNTLVAEGIENNETTALQVGCKIEVIDVNDLNEYITLATSQNADDLVTIFEFLRSGSYNHYWAFHKGLKDKGVTNGCCSLGKFYCKTKEEYPASNEH